jgi:macrolide transport system ATP-binding/permease protein
MRRLWTRLYFLLHRRRLERELAEEMDAHRDMLPPDRRSSFGNTPRLREESREEWSWMWLDRLWKDLSYGVRVLTHAPGFTLGAVAVLSLGVGVNLAEFQVFDAMIFHRLTFPGVDAVVQLSSKSKEGTRRGFPPAAVEFYQKQSSSFAWLSSEDQGFVMTLDTDTGLRSNLVSANYFDGLGIVPAWGRLLDARDSEPGAPVVAVLGYEYWQSHCASDPHMVGRVVHVNNKPVQIVGVLPYSFDGLTPRRTAAWLPVALRPSLIPGSSPIQQDFSRASEAFFGKLKPGISLATGEAELSSLTRELIHTHPSHFRADESIHAEFLQLTPVRTIQRVPAIAIFIVMILLVLLSACANLANMLLARGLARQREIDIRMAIGANRSRIIRQLMTENFLLALLGAVSGLALGQMVARVLLNSLGAPPDMRIALSWNVLAAAFGLTFLSALAFGLPSAVQTVRQNQRRVRLRQSLVAVQVAVSCLLLIASSVLAHNGILQASVDLSFDYQNMAVIAPQLYARNLPAAVARQKLDALTTAMSALPGVEGVTTALIPPLSGRVKIDTLPGLPHVYRNSVAPSYFGVMKVPIVRGRTFLPGEQNVVIVSESAARAIWPNQDPVGKVWNLAGADRTVAGVATDSGTNLLVDPDSVEAYLPILDSEVDASALIVHSRTDPAPLARLAPVAAAALDETVSVSLLRATRDNAIEGQKKLTILIGSIGVVASILAAAGMFAVVAFAVAQRKRELGIRMAIGARPLNILGVLLKQNSMPTLIGAVAGVALSAILLQVVRNIIVLQIRSAVDMIGFGAGLACFVLVAVLATLSPAMRALRIDPSATLREE